MRRLWRWAFPETGDIVLYLVVLTAAVCGLAGVAWWLGILLPGSLLTGLSWRRWRELAAKAARLDAELRARGSLQWRYGLGWGVRHFARAHLLLLLLALKFSQDWFFAGVAYGLGIAAGWLWGVGPWGR
jgi:hypothetical protein